AVPVPNLDLLTYAVPDGLATPCVGARVVVPLGTRLVTGIVVEVGVETGAERRTASAEPRPTNVKPIRELLDTTAFVPGDVVAHAGRHARVSGRPAARRHRQRQDRDLHPPLGGRASIRTPCADAGPRDRADTGGRGLVPRRVRRTGRDPAQRPLRRRAPRSVAA